MLRFKCLAVISLFFAFACDTLPEEEEYPVVNHPNVVLILTDDQGYGDLGIHGNDTIETPVLDNFAKEGVRLDRFFVSPVCAPTRASLLTGRYHLRTGTSWVTGGMEDMQSEEVTLAEMFKQNGYATGCFGKWHNGAHYPRDPLGQGFDEFIGFKAGHWYNYFDTQLEHNQDSIQTKGFITDVLTDYAINFIEENQSQPFFCYIPYNAPHGPFQVPDKYFDKYKAKGLDDKLAAIYGMCENIDDNVGRILQRLDELDINENTIVLFITDNGPNTWRYNGGMRGRKAHVHEGGVRVPSFIQWDSHLPKGRVIDQITAHIDILPTLYELCQLEPIKTQPLDGISLLPLLIGEKDYLDKDRTIFTHQVNGEIKTYPGAVRMPQYRLVMQSENDISLFDMRNDPGETKDLATERKDIVRSLHKDYLRWFSKATSKGVEAPPIPVGYDQAPVVTLPAHEATLSEGLSYKFGPHGWANDWVDQWTDRQDSMYWKLDVVEAGQYKAMLKYTASTEQTGAEMQLTTPNDKVSRKINQPFTPKIISGYDRADRGQESYEQSWGSLVVGSIQLEKGEQRISLKALNIPQQNVGEIKAVVLEKL
ncbi:arylsulfatase A-like enzyme [Catalinimonas alkaloidigena]|uniref:arylsulfatase n=1 Tax=Catalinimonas alkaloidigena TaxID=1075417 RepID=UPI002406D1A2|nr:arylsulfatase [Catalinimonas alkaloidigena]MDF9800701.1 arylsulfatase A-like enzyme [Catalinimonas alkaloidigena]